MAEQHTSHTHSIHTYVRRYSNICIYINMYIHTCTYVHRAAVHSPSSERSQRVAFCIRGIEQGSHQLLPTDQEKSRDRTTVAVMVWVHMRVQYYFTLATLTNNMSTLNTCTRTHARMHTRTHAHTHTHTHTQAANIWGALRKSGC